MVVGHPRGPVLDLFGRHVLRIPVSKPEYHAFFEHVREMFHVFEHFFTDFFTNTFLLWTEHFSRQVLVQKNGGQNMRGLDV